MEERKIKNVIGEKTKKREGDEKVTDKKLYKKVHSKNKILIKSRY